MSEVGLLVLTISPALVRDQPVNSQPLTNSVSSDLTSISVFDTLSVRVFADFPISVFSMSTYFPSGKDLANTRKWLVVDAKGKTVGRLATEVARIISGKNNPSWTPFMDMGDHCVVINARHAIFKGSKTSQKVYRRHTLFPGGLREVSVSEMFAKHPERV